MADQGAEIVDKMENIDISQVVLMQAVFRGALVRKYLRETRQLYEEVFDELEKASSIPLHLCWDDAGICKPKVVKGRRKVADARHAVKKTSEKTANKPTNLNNSAGKDPSFHSVEIQTSFVDVFQHKDASQVDNEEQMLENLDTSWKERVKPFLASDFTGNRRSDDGCSQSNDDLHLRLGSTGGSIASASVKSDMSVIPGSRLHEKVENLSDKDVAQSQKHKNLSPRAVDNVDIKHKLHKESADNASENAAYELESVNSKLSHSVKSYKSDKGESHKRNESSSKHIDGPDDQTDKDTENRKIQDSSGRSADQRSRSRDRTRSHDRSRSHDRELGDNRSRASRSPSSRSRHADFTADEPWHKTDREPSERSIDRHSTHSDHERGQRSGRSERSGDTGQRSARSEDRRSGSGHYSDTGLSHRGEGQGHRSDHWSPRSDRSQRSDRSGGERSDRSRRSEGHPTSSRSHRSDRSERSEVEKPQRGKSPQPSSTSRKDRTLDREDDYPRADKRIEQGRQAESDNRQSGNSTTLTNVTSVWDSFASRVDDSFSSPLPDDANQLCEVRKNVAMELLWIQQAIDSRKNYLRLKGTI